MCLYIRSAFYVTAELGKVSCPSCLFCQRFYFFSAYSNLFFLFKETSDFRNTARKLRIKQKKRTHVSTPAIFAFYQISAVRNTFLLFFSSHSLVRAPLPLLLSVRAERRAPSPLSTSGGRRDSRSRYTRTKHSAQIDCLSAFPVLLLFPLGICACFSPYLNTARILFFLLVQNALCISPIWSSTAAAFRGSPLLGGERRKGVI